MLGEYELDFKALKYWIAGLTVISLTAAVFLVDLPKFNSQSPDSGSSLEVVPQAEPVNPNQLTRVRVIEGGSNIQGAEVRLDGLYIGYTNSEGILLFEALEQDFNVTASINDTQASEIIEVEEGVDSEDNPEFVDSGDEEDSEDQDSQEDESSDSSDDSSNDSDQDSDEDQQEEESFTGFRLEEDPVAGETNTLTFLIDGGTQGNQAFTINGDQAETMPTGSYTFTVPNAQTLRLEASDVSNSFQVEGYEESSDDVVSGDITPAFERSGPEYAGETLRFNASGTESQNPIEAYRWTFSHENFNDTLQGEVIEYQIPEEGAYDIELEVEDSEGFTETKNGYMRAEPSYSGPEIILTSPSTGDTVEAEYDFEFQVDNARRGQSAHVMIGGREESSTQLEPGLNILEGSDALRAPISESGTQNYRIEVRDEGGTWSSSSREIENIRAYNDFGTFTVESPSDGAEVNGGTAFEFGLDLKESVRLSIDGDSEEESFSNSTVIDSSRNSYSFNQNLNASEYQWQASISVTGTSERKSSSMKTLTVN